MLPSLIIQITWSASTSEVFQVREISEYLDSIWTSTSAISTFWCKLLPRKTNLFLWRARKSFLPCLLQLAIKGISVPSLACPLCGDATEDINDHALFRYHLPRRVGSVPLIDCEDVFSEVVLNLVPTTPRPLWAAVLYVAAWTIWKEWNLVVIENKSSSLLYWYFQT